MKSLVELFPQPAEVNEDGQRRSCLVRETLASGEVVEADLWFIYPKNVPMPKDNNCDSYLLGTLLLAMKLKTDISVHGSVSKELLVNLTELQAVWNKWCPETYSLIDIQVDDIRDDDVQADGAIVAFSGGVDAQFTAYRHATDQAGYCTQKISAGVLIHGFDIPFADAEGFAGAAKKAANALDDLGLPLLVVKTNLSRVWGKENKSRSVNWEHQCGMAVAATLTGLSNVAGTGLIGSGEPYDALVAPWGSHPITDPLCSSGSFNIIHDGAGFNRSEKTKVLAKWSAGMKNLRVCWVGDLKDSNCGICEKCVRTRLNFLLADAANPGCFSDPINKKMFENISLNSEAARTEWQLIRNEIKSTGKAVKWLPEVEKALKRKAGPKLRFLLPQGSQRRDLIKKLLKKVN